HTELELVREGRQEGETVRSRRCREGGELRVVAVHARALGVDTAGDQQTLVEAEKLFLREVREVLHEELVLTDHLDDAEVHVRYTGRQVAAGVRDQAGLAALLAKAGRRRRRREAGDRVLVPRREVQVRVDVLGLVDDDRAIEAVVRLEVRFGRREDLAVVREGVHAAEEREVQRLLRGAVRREGRVHATDVAVHVFGKLHEVRVLERVRARRQVGILDPRLQIDPGWRRGEDVTRGGDIVVVVPRETAIGERVHELVV